MLLFKKYLFIWLRRVLVVARGIFMAARGLLSSCSTRAQQLWRVGLVALQHVGSQFPDQGSNPRPLHWKVDSYSWTTREVQQPALLSSFKKFPSHQSQTLPPLSSFLPTASSHQTLATSNLLSISMNLFWIFHINGIIGYVTFYDWLLLLSIMIWRFIHLVAYISILFFFMVEKYSIMWIYHILFTQS